MACTNMPEKRFEMHRSLQIYIERTYGKTQSVVLGGNPRHHRFFVRQVALIFRLTVGAFAFLLRLDFSLIVGTMIAKVTYHLPDIL